MRFSIGAACGDTDGCTTDTNHLASMIGIQTDTLQKDMISFNEVTLESIQTLSDKVDSRCPPS